MNKLDQPFNELVKHLANGHPLAWESVLSQLNLDQQSEVLVRLARMTCFQGKGMGFLANHLKVDKANNQVLFNQIFFGFLCPVHDILVKDERWDEALSLEHGLYSCFIKQDENIDFYELAFSRLYEPYLKGAEKKTLRLQLANGEISPHKTRLLNVRNLLKKGKCFSCFFPTLI